MKNITKKDKSNKSQFVMCLMSMLCGDIQISFENTYYDSKNTT